MYRKNKSAQKFLADLLNWFNLRHLSLEALFNTSVIQDSKTSHLKTCLFVRLMGSMALSNHYRSEDLLDIETAAGGFQQRKGMKQCLPLTFCFHTGLSQYLALEGTEGRTRSEIFYHCPVGARLFGLPLTAQPPSFAHLPLSGSGMFRSELAGVLLALQLDTVSHSRPLIDA